MLMIQSKPDAQVTVLEVTDPEWIARHRKQDERHKRNLQWLQAHCQQRRWGLSPLNSSV